MRRIIASLSIAAIVVTGFPSPQVHAQAQVASAPVPGPQIVSETVAGFPSGGDALKARISDLIYDRPELAADVANYLRTEAAGLNAAQKEAIEAGLADGLNRLGVVGQVTASGSSAYLLGLGLAAAAAGGLALAAATKKSCTPVSPNTTC